MKKIAKFFIALSFAMIAFMIIGIFYKNNENKRRAYQIQTIPAFAFTNIKTSALYTDNNIINQINLFIVYFHPECGFCDKQADEISKNSIRFKDSQILFISNADSASMNSFAVQYKLSDKENIIFLQDKDFIFDDIFGKTGTPATFIYDKNRKLVKQFKGFVPAHEILKYLEE